MTDPVDFNAKKKQRDQCLYCGNDGHKTPLACPRISGIEVDPDTGCLCGVNFWPEVEIDPKPPAAA